MGRHSHDLASRVGRRGRHRVVGRHCMLSEHGAEYGLCQIYDNEPWHYELRPDAIEHGCPTRYADPTQDPRLQQ